MYKLSYIILILFLAGCETDKFDLTNIPKEDRFKDYVISYKCSESFGTRIGSDVNDQLELDLYLPDYNVQKAEEICRFYDEYFKAKANEYNKKLTIYIYVWCKLLPVEELRNMDNKKKYCTGRLIHNYKNDVMSVNIKEPEKYFMK